MFLTRKTLDAVRDDLSVALATVGAKHGVAISLGNMRFAEDHAVTRLTILTAAPVQGTAVAQTPTDAERFLFESLAPRVGLAPGHYGQVLVLDGRSVTLCGVRPDNPRNPVLVRTARGTIYKMPVEPVKEALERLFPTGSARGLRLVPRHPATDHASRSRARRGPGPGRMR